MPKGKRGKIVGVAKCSIEGCERRVKALMLCGPHYHHQKDWEGTLRQNRQRRYDNRERYMWYHLRRRALKKGILFAIEESDIVIPTTCPVLGIPILRDEGAPRDNLPSLDRIIPALGYVRGNIAVISMRANQLKNAATLDELTLIRDWLAKQIHKEETC